MRVTWNDRDLPITFWEPIGTVHLLGRCDICGRRPLLARHHEVFWGYEFGLSGRAHGWLWACTRCLANEQGDIAEVGLRETAVAAATEVYQRTLLELNTKLNENCPELELCNHESCASSYRAWALADAALREELLR